jgi:hypothetical protein
VVAVEDAKLLFWCPRASVQSVTLTSEAASSWTQVVAIRIVSLRVQFFFFFMRPVWQRGFGELY